MVVLVWAYLHHSKRSLDLPDDLLQKERKRTMQDPGRKSLSIEDEAAANLVNVAINLRKAKEVEARTKANRIKLEELLASLVPTKEIGQTTTVLTNGMKVTVKRGYNYSADLAEIGAILVQNADDELPAPVKVKTTRSLDVKGYEWYRENHPGLFKLLAEHVTVTPAKVSVTVGEAEVVNDE